MIKIYKLYLTNFTSGYVKINGSSLQWDQKIFDIKNGDTIVIDGLNNFDKIKINDNEYSGANNVIYLNDTNISATSIGSATGYGKGAKVEIHFTVTKKYNPRQISRLRFLDQKLLEKLCNVIDVTDDGNVEFGKNIYVDGAIEGAGVINSYDFNTGTTEEKKELFKNAIEQISLGNVVKLKYDFTALAWTSNGTDKIYGVAIDGNTGAIGYVITFDTYLKRDRINPRLYNHSLTITAGEKLYYIEYQASSNLKVDSLQDLTTLTKATNGTKIGLGNTYIGYDGSLWKIGGETAVTNIADNVMVLL